MYIKLLNLSYNNSTNTCVSTIIIGKVLKGLGIVLANQLKTALLTEFPYFKIIDIKFFPESSAYKPLTNTLESVDQITKNLLELEFAYSFEFFAKNKQNTLFSCSGKQQGAGILYAKDLILPIGMKCLSPEKKIAHVNKNGFLAFMFDISLFFCLNSFEKNIRLNYNYYSIKSYPIKNINTNIIHTSGYENILLELHTKGNLHPNNVIKIINYMLLNKQLILIKSNSTSINYEY